VLEARSDCGFLADVLEGSTPLLCRLSRVVAIVDFWRTCWRQELSSSFNQGLWVFGGRVGGVDNNKDVWAKFMEWFAMVQ